jgi:hypothetical protein
MSSLATIVNSPSGTVAMALDHHHLLPRTVATKMGETGLHHKTEEHRMVETDLHLHLPRTGERRMEETDPHRTEANRTEANKTEANKTEANRMEETDHPQRRITRVSPDQS